MKATNWINNGDSIQYVNPDQSIMLFFSVVKFSGSSLLPEDVLLQMQPSVTRREDNWQFKASKSGENQVLVCVFWYTKEGDENVVRALFDAIEFVG